MSGKNQTVQQTSATVACAVVPGRRAVVGVGEAHPRAPLQTPAGIDIESLRTVFDGLDAAVLLFDVHGSLRDANTAAFSQLHLRRGRAAPYTLHDVLRIVGHAPTPLLRIWHVLMNSAAAQSMQCRLRPRGNGRPFDADVHFKKVRAMDGSALVIVTVRDISAQTKELRRWQRLASLDELTRVANRRHFLRSLEQELQRGTRYRHALSLLMVDVDHFKAINDRYGHATGDEILQLLARLMKDTCREADVIGRLGGEEFAVTLPETSIEKAAAVAERLRAVIAATPLVTPFGEIIFTVSVGVACACADRDAGTAALLARADAALYRAKHLGRNRVVVDETVAA